MFDDEVFVTLPGLTEKPTIPSYSVRIFFVRVELGPEGDEAGDDLLDDVDIFLEFLRLVDKLAEDVDSGVEKLIGGEAVERGVEKGCLSNFGRGKPASGEPRTEGLKHGYLNCGCYACIVTSSSYQNEVRDETHLVLGYTSPAHQ